MLGLVCLTLNKNPGIGDEGASKLATALVDDISLNGKIAEVKITY